MNIGYARVSTGEQNLDMQITALKEAGCEKIFVEKISGMKKRPELEAALSHLRKGDCLVVYRMDRIGRSLPDLISIISTLNKNGIWVKFLLDKIETNDTPVGELITNLFAILADFDRKILLARFKDGREEAKRKGIKFGRPEGLPLDKVSACSILYKSGVPVKSIMENLSIRSTSTIYRYLKEKGIDTARKKK